MFNIEGMMKIINKEESIVARFRGLFEAEWSRFKWWRLYREVDMSSMMVLYFTRRVATPPVSSDMLLFLDRRFFFLLCRLSHIQNG
jgi:hypothetical protein